MNSLQLNEIEMIEASSKVYFVRPSLNGADFQYNELNSFILSIVTNNNLLKSLVAYETCIERFYNKKKMANENDKRELHATMLAVRKHLSWYNQYIFQYKHALFVQAKFSELQFAAYELSNKSLREYLEKFFDDYLIKLDKLLADLKNKKKLPIEIEISIINLKDFLILSKDDSNLKLNAYHLYYVFKLFNKKNWGTYEYKSDISQYPGSVMDFRGFVPSVIGFLCLVMSLYFSLLGFIFLALFLSSALPVIFVIVSFGLLAGFLFLGACCEVIDNIAINTRPDLAEKTYAVVLAVENHERKPKDQIQLADLKIYDSVCDSCLIDKVIHEIAKLPITPQRTYIIQIMQECLADHNINLDKIYYWMSRFDKLFNKEPLLAPSGNKTQLGLEVECLTYTLKKQYLSLKITEVCDKINKIDFQEPLAEYIKNFTKIFVRVKEQKIQTIPKLITILEDVHSLLNSGSNLTTQSIQDFRKTHDSIGYRKTNLSSIVHFFTNRSNESTALTELLNTLERSLCVKDNDRSSLNEKNGTSNQAMSYLLLPAI